VKGNNFGMAVGQPTFLTTMGNSALTPQDAAYAWD
jgi:hypothetical protein